MAGTILLLWPAIFNHFPVMDRDTASYLDSAFKLEAPWDRPITYGLFLRAFSLNGLSLWPVIIVQSFLATWLIFLAARLFFDPVKHWYRFFILIIILAFLTPLAWTVCKVIPDIFTAYGILSLALILNNPSKKITRIFLFVTFFFSNGMHHSNFPVHLGLILLFFALWLFNVRNVRKKMIILNLVMVLLLTLSGYLFMSTSYSKSRHVFFMGAMVEHGILQEFLDQECPERTFEFCKYKDKIPRNAIQFIWSEDSPLQDMGGWKNTKEEFNRIITETLTRPKYLVMHLRESVKATLQQLITFRIIHFNASFTEDSAVYKRIDKYLPHLSGHYLVSRQTQKKLTLFRYVSHASVMMVGLSLLYILFSLIFLKVPLHSYQKVFLSVIVAGIIMNAWICGTFANVLPRLESRLIWLLPCAALLLFHRFRLLTCNS